MSEMNEAGDAPVADDYPHEEPLQDGAPSAVSDAPVAEEPPVEPTSEQDTENAELTDEGPDAEYDEEIDGIEDFDEDDSEGANYMQNRELSWLTFNERVLDQGADESVPLLERLNFISIFWSNLREFFMVRVGSLTDLSFIEPPIIDSKTGMSAKEQIRAIHERCSELYPIQESYYEHVRGSLAKQGVRHLRPEDLSEEQRNYLVGLVQHNIEPFLSPQIINSRHPFPHLENGKLYILVRLDDEASAESRKKKKKDKAKKKEKGGAEGVLLGLIPLPHQCERVIKLPGRGFQFILLEHAIEMFVPEIFHMYKIKHTNVICVTRNADIDANQGFDEQDEDYREHMKRLLKKRARLAPVRLECERPLSPVMEKLMLGKLGLKRFQVYDTIVPLDLSFTWGLGSRLSDKKRESLSNTPFAPAWPTCFDRNRPIMDQVMERETLLFYPYESMDPFVQLLREAASDPSVVSIKITLYRLASQSHLAEALIAAADNGKEVTALFELRARFDESNNIMWSQRFEEAGCNVIYGFRDYKVHSKICCITRQTPDGLKHITQLGTGNYNEKTAKLYTDLSFITTDEAFGRDAMEFFRNMQLENVSDNYEVLRVAPLQIKPLILDSLDEQIERARQGKPAYAFMKANSITDKDVIEKISEASNAGVDITLFVRGICCIVPEVKGATENVHVFSIVGRLLEHSRIYCFGTPDDCMVYLSSADLMTRNLNKRVEIAWPVLDPVLRGRILSYIDVCMHDTAKLRELRPNATYTPLGALCDLDEDGMPLPAFDAQNMLIEQAAQAARDVLEAEEERTENEPDTDANAEIVSEDIEPPPVDTEPVEAPAEEPIAAATAAAVSASAIAVEELAKPDDPAAEPVIDESPLTQESASEPSAEVPATIEPEPLAEDAATDEPAEDEFFANTVEEDGLGADYAVIDMTEAESATGEPDDGADEQARTEPAIANEISSDSSETVVDSQTSFASEEPLSEQAAELQDEAGQTPDASERIAELIDRFGSVEQKRNPTFERLTDMNIDDIVALPEEELSPEPEPSDFDEEVPAADSSETTPAETPAPEPEDGEDATDSEQVTASETQDDLPDPEEKPVEGGQEKADEAVPEPQPPRRRRWFDFFFGN